MAIDRHDPLERTSYFLATYRCFGRRKLKGPLHRLPQGQQPRATAICMNCPRICSQAGPLTLAIIRCDNGAIDVPSMKMAPPMLWVIGGASYGQRHVL